VGGFGGVAGALAHFAAVHGLPVVCVLGCGGARGKGSRPNHIESLTPPGNFRLFISCRVMPHEQAWEGDSFFLHGTPGAKEYIVINS